MNRELESPEGIAAMLRMRAGLESQAQMHPSVDLLKRANEIASIRSMQTLADSLHVADDILSSHGLNTRRDVGNLFAALKFPAIDDSMAALGEQLRSSASNALAGFASRVALPDFAISPAWTSVESLHFGKLLRDTVDGSALSLQLERVLNSTESVARMFEDMERREREFVRQSALASRTWNSLADMTMAAEKVWSGLNPLSIAEVSPSLLRAPTLEIYSAARALNLVRPGKASVTVALPDLESEMEIVADGFEARLARFDPALAEMYQGAAERIQLGGPDWARHALTSFRELSTHTLHSLAPDAEVTPWAKPEHFSRGKLTRRARMEFIFRNVSGGDLSEFMSLDIAAAAELFQVLNKVHKKKHTITEEQFRILRNRIRGFIDMLLEASGH